MKIRRTYNLPSDVVTAVKVLVEERHVAPTQDALVEAAIRQYSRLLADQDERRRWSEAATDLELQEELSELWTAFEQEDRTAWDR